MLRLVELDHFCQAFRYVSGELAGDEAAAFEQILADDQAAREAVAEAVELSLAVSSLAADTPSTWSRGRDRPFRWRRPLAWVSSGIAATVALAFTLRDVEPPAARPPVAPPPALGPEQAVALAWSGLHEEIELDPDGLTDLMAWSDESMVEADFEADSPLPPWLIEAASLHGPDHKPTKEN